MKNIMRFFLLLILFACLSCAQKERSMDQKPVPQPNSDTTYGYYINIHQADSRFVHSISTSMSFGLTIADGEMINYDAHKLFFGYDSTIISIGNVSVLPLKVGKTMVYLKNPTHLESVADSIVVEVTKVKNKFLIQTRRAP